MSRLAILSRDEVRDPVALRVFAEIERELGFGIVPNVFMRMAAAPAFLEAQWNAFRSTVLQGKLPRVLKEMVGVVVSAVHDSPYARQIHLHSLGVQGIEKGVLQALGEGRTEVGSLSPASSAVLRFAKKATASPRGVDDADFATLRAAGLDEAAIFEVLATIQVFTAVNLFTDLAAVPVDSV